MIHERAVAGSSVSHTDSWCWDCSSSQHRSSRSSCSRSSRSLAPCRWRGGPRNATLNFGNVSAFEPLNTGVSRSRTAANYTLSTNFGVHVRRLVGLSANYSLQARLRNANALTWRVDGMTMSTTAATVATSQPYGTTVPHLLAFVVPFSHAAGAVTMVLEVTAIAN